MFNTINALTFADTGLALARAGCYVAAGCIIGKKATLGLSGASLNACSKIADLFNHTQLSKSLRKKGNDLIKSAKKDLIRDVTVAGSLALAGLAFEPLKDSIAYKLRVETVDHSTSSTEFLTDIGNFVFDTTSSLKNRLSIMVYGDQRYLLERMKDNAVSFKNFVINDFRLTTPYKESVTDTYFGLCGPACQKNIYEEITKNINATASLKDEAIYYTNAALNAVASLKDEAIHYTNAALNAAASLEDEAIHYTNAV